MKRILISIYIILLNCCPLLSQRVNTSNTIGIGASTIVDQLEKDQFQTKVSYFIKSGFWKNDNIFGSNFNFRYTNKGAYNEVTGKNLNLHYIGFDIGIHVNSNLTKSSFNIYLDLLTNNNHKSQHKYGYKFNVLDFGLEASEYFEIISREKMKIYLGFLTAISISSIYPNSKYGPFVPLTSRKSKWTRNLIFSIPFKITIW